MRTHHSRQEGITLLLTILILAALSTIIFGLAAVTLQEIRTSTDTTVSEQVISSDEAATEYSMYALTRGSTYGTVSGNCGSPTAMTLYSVHVSVCAASYDPSPYPFTLAAHSSQTFLFFNPSDWYGTSCSGSGTNCPGYTSISITENTGSATGVYLCNWATTGCDPANDYGSTMLTNGSPWTSGPLSSTSEYQLVVDHSTGGTANYTMTTTTATAPVYGPPSGATNLTVSGTLQGITRKLQSTVGQ